MMRSSAKTAVAFTLSFTCLLPSQAFAGISITSYLSAQEPVFTSTAESEDDKPLSEVSLVKESGIKSDGVKGSGVEKSNSEEYKIGVMVKALSRAIASPDEPDSLKIITQYGTDSRYYVMIRGWLVQELSGAQSQLDATRDATAKTKFIERAAFLTQAIRRIDLE
ncbi:hypothetical protein Ssed_0637 [Shewanella sediminis HAW-EB3]|uniref:Uncharacterized protein n=1 Tax=Shewanella sediminis (strain HAW-EB3) TaxID=425104 RepID=A8FQX6_SHESH|nr:hypothetical protein [Shewanella sediminis]ABV35249.1 hypothetical protein Ssed_0637 [Shewanella sediminis HAW-EB3]